MHAHTFCIHIQPRQCVRGLSFFPTPKGMGRCSRCLRCFGKDVDEAKKKSDPLRFRRLCTDVLCCLFFFVFVALLFAILVFALITGDFEGVRYDSDYLGHRCGSGSNEGKPKAFYPRIARDLFDQRELILSGHYSKIRLYALCVPECPPPFDLTDPKNITDYGYDRSSAVTQALGDGTRPAWIAATPTVDFLNRCIPRTESDSSMVKMCAYPICTAAEVAAVNGQCTDNPELGQAWMLCNGTNAEECQTQIETCALQLKYTGMRVYTIPTTDEQSQALLASVTSFVGGVLEVVTSLVQAWPLVVAFGLGAPIGVGFVYMILLYFFAKVIIWMLCVLMLFIELATIILCAARSGISIEGISAQSLLSDASSAMNVTVPDAVVMTLAEVDTGNKWMYTAALVILIILFLITIISILLARKKITKCASIIQESTTVFKSMPSMLIFPVLFSVVQAGITAVFIVGLCFLRSLKPESIDRTFDLLPNATLATSWGYSAASASMDPIEALRNLHESDALVLMATILFVYGYFVIFQFMQNLAWCTMSAATGWWFYFEGSFKNQHRFPLARALLIQLIFHSGSIAFAAFIIAFFDLIRYVVSYIARHAEAASKKSALRVVFSCLQCCILCIQRTVEYISYYGLVFVAVNGCSFCSGCFKTVGFLSQNAAQCAVNTLVVWLLKMFTVGTTPLVCAFITFYLTELAGNPSPFWPCLVVFVVAAGMTVSVMAVFDAIVTTVYVCAFEDASEYDGAHLANHPMLVHVFELDKLDATGSKVALVMPNSPSAAASPSLDVRAQSL